MTHQGRIHLFTIGVDTIYRAWSAPGFHGALSTVGQRHITSDTFTHVQFPHRVTGYARFGPSATLGYRDGYPRMQVEELL